MNQQPGQNVSEKNPQLFASSAPPDYVEIEQQIHQQQGPVYPQLQQPQMQQIQPQMMQQFYPQQPVMMTLMPQSLSALKEEFIQANPLSN